MTSSITSALLLAAGQRDRILDCARRLIAVQSPNPPGDTHAVAAVAAELIRALAPGAAVSLYRTSETVGNLVAVVRGTGPGRQPERRPGEQTARRLVLSGHLDTYPLGDAAGWTVAPFAGEVRDGRLYGRGAADMKGGIAASIVALAALATHADAWPGEAVLALRATRRAWARSARSGCWRTFRRRAATR
jgi:acetylornithine deacetylase/succinyl-diaminopimelate desuccinylase-like protein